MGRHKAKRVFTEEEMEALRNNPYTYRVTPSTISFTKEFKEKFWADYQAGEGKVSPREIVEKYGYDPDVLGSDRLSGIQSTLRKTYLSGQEFYEGSRPREKKASAKPKSSKDTRSTDPAVRDLQARVDYLEQEIEFLKKISSARITKK